ncbi:MAG: hypothetical protein ACOYMA_18955 [Bacteroidia bacterium]
MKYLTVIATMLLTFGFANAQKVFSANNEAFAENNNGKWYFVNNEVFADLKIYFVNNEAFAW